MVFRRSSKIHMSVALMIQLANAGQESFAFMGNNVSPTSSVSSICSRSVEVVGRSIATLQTTRSNCRYNTQLYAVSDYQQTQRKTHHEGHYHDEDQQHHDPDQPRTETTRELQFHYQILGLSRKNCDAKKIKESYRRLARIYHPDANQKRDTTERFQQINQAYDQCMRDHLDNVVPLKEGEETKSPGGPGGRQQQQQQQGPFEDHTNPDNHADDYEPFEDDRFFDSCTYLMSVKGITREEARARIATQEIATTTTVARQPRWENRSTRANMPPPPGLGPAGAGAVGPRFHGPGPRQPAWGMNNRRSSMRAMPPPKMDSAMTWHGPPQPQVRVGVPTPDSRVMLGGDIYYPQQQHPHEAMALEQQFRSQPQRVGGQQTQHVQHHPIGMEQYYGNQQHQQNQRRHPYQQRQLGPEQQQYYGNQHQQRGRRHHRRRHQYQQRPIGPEPQYYGYPQQNQQHQYQQQVRRQNRHQQRPLGPEPQYYGYQHHQHQQQHQNQQQVRRQSRHQQRPLGPEQQYRNHHHMQQNQRYYQAAPSAMPRSPSSMHEKNGRPGPAAAAGAGGNGPKNRKANTSFSTTSKTTPVSVGEDLAFNIHIDFLTAMYGGEETIHVRHWETCKACDGKEKIKQQREQRNLERMQQQLELEQQLEQQQQQQMQLMQQIQQQQQQPSTTRMGGMVPVGVPCQLCRGTGVATFQVNRSPSSGVAFQDIGQQTNLCPTCNGSGMTQARLPQQTRQQQQQKHYQQHQKQQQQMSATIPVSGKVKEDNCPCDVCGDRGIVANIKSVKVTIPAGSKDGNLLLLAGEGAAGPNGGTAGDLYLTLRVSDFDGEYDLSEVLAEMEKDDDTDQDSETDDDEDSHQEATEVVIEEEEVESSQEATEVVVVEEEAESSQIPVGADVGYFKS